MNTEKEYLALFSDAGSRHIAIGEASVWYLYSEDALPSIRDFNPDARVLVFFRNPVDFVQSLHAQFAYNGRRKPDFPAAWGNPKSQARLIASGLFGNQIERLRSIFPRDQVLTILLDDLKAQPRREYLRALDFLGLDDDGRTDFDAQNVHKKHRSLWLAEFVQRTPSPITKTWQAIKSITGIREIGAMERLKRLNKKPVRRQAIDPALRASVFEAFAEDIALLERQLGRDLSEWR